MRIHVFQHVPFEGIGCLADFLDAAGANVEYTRWYEQDYPPPHLEGIECLIVMGGPMGVHDDSEFPWLAQEKRLIKEAIEAGIKVLGICLGAQLIAHVMGAKVAFGGHREIGWHALKPESSHPLATLICTPHKIFHWHGDTFEIPAGAIRLASSEGCPNQAFIFNERVFAFQFHLETTRESAQALITHCSNDLDASRFVQSAHEIVTNQNGFEEINATMIQVWNYICQA